MRTGQLVKDDLSVGMLKELRMEADYFGLQGLKDQIDEAMKPKQPSPDDESNYQRKRLQMDKLCTNIQ